MLLYLFEKGFVGHERLLLSQDPSNDPLNYEFYDLLLRFSKF